MLRPFAHRVVDINLTAVIGTFALTIMSRCCLWCATNRVCVVCRVLEGTQQAICAMADNEKGGVVINVASMGGLLPMPQSPVYAAAKAGVVNFTRSLAAFGKSSGIRVNAIWYRNPPLFLVTFPASG